MVNTCRDFEHHPLAQDTSAHKGNIPYGRGWCCSNTNFTLNYKENFIRSLPSRGWCNVFCRVVQCFLQGGAVTFMIDANYIVNINRFNIQEGMVQESEHALSLHFLGTRFHRSVLA